MHVASMFRFASTILAQMRYVSAYVNKTKRSSPNVLNDPHDQLPVSRMRIEQTKVYSRNRKYGVGI